MATAEGAQVTRLELADFDVPLYNADLEAKGTPRDVVRLKEIFHAHPAWIICSPEYNGSYTALLKNTIDWVSSPIKGDPNWSSGTKPFAGKVVGLLATGGSTNHTIHLVAMARAAGIVIDWDDFDTLSQAVPLLTRIYPNGSADINHFHAAGGMGTVYEAEQLGLERYVALKVLHPHVAKTPGAIARFQRSLGRDVRLVTGTDEHGLKMAQAARTEGVEPRLFAETEGLYITVDDLEARIEHEHSTITYGGKDTLVESYPISIEWPPTQDMIGKPTADCREDVRVLDRVAGREPEDARIGAGERQVDRRRARGDRTRAARRAGGRGAGPRGGGR